jgi:hypothetical protein
MTKLLCQRYARRYNRPVYVLNERSGEEGSGFKKITWEGVRTLEKAILLVDDLIGNDESCLDILREVLTCRHHHNQVSPVFIVSHRWDQ